MWENNINETWNNTWHKYYIFKNWVYIFFPFLPFPNASVKSLLKLRTWCFRVKSIWSTSSLTIIYSHFMIYGRQLPGEKTDTNILCKPLWKRYQCGLLDSITSSQPWKNKNVNISTLQSVKLLNYFYGNEFEGCNISRTSQNLSKKRISRICPKNAKFCTRNITSVYLTVKSIYTIFRRSVKTIETCVRIIPFK